MRGGTSLPEERHVAPGGAASAGPARRAARPVVLVPASRLVTHGPRPPVAAQAFDTRAHAPADKAAGRGSGALDLDGVEKDEDEDDDDWMVSQEERSHVISVRLKRLTQDHVTFTFAYP